MLKQGLVVLISVSLLLPGCSQTNQQTSNSGQVMAEGAGLGALIGGVAGLAFGGGDRGKAALIGAAAGGLIGLAAGGYVAHQKSKYATIEQRIAGEREIAAQAASTARAQTNASAARLRVVDAQLNELSRTQSSRQSAQAATSGMLADLQRQRSDLASQRTALEQHIKDQNAFIADTEHSIDPNDQQKAIQLASWKAEIPRMQAALNGMSEQITEIDAMETRVERISSTCC